MSTSASATDFNFRDLDVLGLGPVARQTSAVFDRFWNSDWVVPVTALKLDATTRDLRAEKPRILQSIEGTPVLEHFPLNRKDWESDLAELRKERARRRRAVCSPICQRPTPSGIACPTPCIT